MANPMKPPAVSARSALWWIILTMASMVGGYQWFKQRDTTGFTTEGYAISLSAKVFTCNTSLNNTVSEVPQLYLRMIGERAAQGKAEVYLLVDGTKLYVGDNWDLVRWKRAKVWVIDKDSADQLVARLPDPDNPVNDRIATMVIDKTNGTGLFKDILNRKFQYLSCQEKE
jgi:hypothetical protein